SLPSQRDELRWDVHGDLFQDWSVQTYTLRHNGGETALPIRRLQAFKPGEGMGGAANHWKGRPGAGANPTPFCVPTLRTGMERRLFPLKWRSRIGRHLCRDGVLSRSVR